MNETILFNFFVDKANNRIHVKRSFDAPIDLVWAAWTESDILDRWWAPKPYKAFTQSMNFVEGGRWHYLMLAPGREKQWGLFDYDLIKPLKFFSGINAFCDENAIIDQSKPQVKWENEFNPNNQETILTITLQFASLEDLETIVNMGLKEGFTERLESLDQYIAAQFYLRKQNKPDNKARVSTYLNFPGNTEEAFNFYRSVFKTDFINGLQRFGELPADPEQPAIANNVKQMVLHVELPISGGHILMGSDAPKEMGFSVLSGNNMHINLEPDSKKEADRIFNELSAGGTVEMPIQDMFWGAYYGSFTDKFGINWMINYQSK
ncbi:MAG TPA: SRPBCC domain-containing protein [Sphingobacteriaceae bacterium]